MTIMNNDTAQAWTLPKGTIFTAPDGAQFATAFATTVPKATKTAGANGGKAVLTAGQQDIWVNAVKKGKASLDRQRTENTGSRASSARAPTRSCTASARR